MFAIVAASVARRSIREDLKNQYGALDRRVLVARGPFGALRRGFLSLLLLAG